MGFIFWGVLCCLEHVTFLVAFHIIMINDHYQPVITHFLVHAQPNIRHGMGKEKILRFNVGASSKAYRDQGHSEKNSKVVVVWDKPETVCHYKRSLIICPGALKTIGCGFKLEFPEQDGLYSVPASHSHARVWALRCYQILIFQKNPWNLSLS